MATTKEYNEIFDQAIDFAVYSINQHCDTNFDSLEALILSVRFWKALECSLPENLVESITKREDV
jgi:hypothetical protein